MDKTAINSNKQSRLWICRNAKLPSLQYLFFYFMTMIIIIKWTNWHLLTCGCFPPQQYGYTDSPYSTGQGSILSQLQAYLIRSSCIDFRSSSHWLDDSRLWLVSRHPASPPYCIYQTESSCTHHWAALPWSTFSTLSTLSAPRCTKSDLSAPRNI